MANGGFLITNIYHDIFLEYSKFPTIWRDSYRRMVDREGNGLPASHPVTKALEDLNSELVVETSQELSFFVPAWVFFLPLQAIVNTREVARLRCLARMGFGAGQWHWPALSEAEPSTFIHQRLNSPWMASTSSWYLSVRGWIGMPLPLMQGPCPTLSETSA